MERSTLAWAAVIVAGIGVGLAQDSDPVQINFATYNVQSLPDWLQSWLYIPNQNRTEYIPNELLTASKSYFGDAPGIICFQEAFSKDIRRHIQEFANNNDYHYTGPIAPEPLNLQFINGGVVLLSNTPLTYVEHHGFPTNSTCGADMFARKGFIYVETIVGGLTIGIIATHLQASDDWCVVQAKNLAGVVKGKQLRQLEAIKTFLEGKGFNERHVDAVFLIGDLNISSFNIHKQSIDFDLISEQLELLGANQPDMISEVSPSGQTPTSSFDPVTNTYTQELRRQNKLKVLPPAEHIDYVMAIGRVPASIAVTNAIIPIRRKNLDLSDHYAVMGSARISSNASPVSG